MRWPAFAVLCAGAAACGSGSDSGADAGGRDGAANETTCADAEARLGHAVCVPEVKDRATWESITFELAAVDQARATTFLVPARSDARVPTTVFVDADAFETPEESLHYKFLTESFPELALLSYEEYLELTLDAGSREWFAGSVTEYVAADRDPVFGFTIWDRGEDAASAISCEQFRMLHAELAARIAIGEVAVVPAHALQRETLAGCDLPVHDPSVALDYEVYTRAKGCGTVRRYTLAELTVAARSAEFGWQDLLVTDEAPLDIETVIAGIVTGTRQGELSHLNVRSASRGTPNCYVKNAYALLAKWDGKLVEMECGAAGASVVAITPAEAERCNEGRRPDPVEVAPPDLAPTELVPLLELPTDSAEERRAGVARYGSKGTNLAVLYQRIDPALQLDGFLIPMHHYDAFMRSGRWSVDLGAGPEELSFQATIERLLEDPEFRTDGALRRMRLEALQAAIGDAPCDPALIDALSEQIRATYGGAEDAMVRFRSSSNAEDTLGFNGAGLYDSTSVCLADDLDADDTGPSQCDPDQPSERGICRGLTHVWGSLWKLTAFEEREWYGIDHSAVAMGILVDTRTKDELANVVAFTGNPLLQGDRRYLINAQLGELDVVAAVPGVWPEKDLLTLEDGKVEKIERGRGSTELPDGEWVLDDAQLEELGARLAEIATVYPLDEMAPPTARVYLDTEWKLRADGHFVIKQVRPFME